MAFDGVPEELSYEVFSLRTGFNDGQHVFDEAVSSFTASLEVQCTPDHSVTKAAFATVVCGCHVRIFQESPIDAYAVRTHAVRSCAEPAQQKRFHSLADGAKISFERFMSGRAVVTHCVFSEQSFRVTHQVVPEAFELRVGRINQRLKIVFQVVPAPLQDLVLIGHPGAIAIDADGEFAANQFGQHDGLACGPQNEDGEAGRDERLQPCFRQAAAEGGFIDPRIRLTRQCLGKLLVNGLEHRGCLLFECADMRGATRYLTDVAAACGHFTTRSTKPARQQYGRKHRFGATDDGFRAFPLTWTRHTRR